MKKTYLIYIGAALFAVFFHSCRKEAIKEKSTDNITTGKKLPAVQANTSSIYWQRANETHNFVYGNLLTPFNSYKVNLTTPNTAYEWYNVSQIYADAAMVGQGASAYAPYMNNTYAWMNNMWDGASGIGGYFAAANVNGSGAAGDKYVDDNALTGVIYLDCYNVTSGTTRTNYLNSAKAVANYLMNSALWDNVYGGGFWWNTQKTLKPTQSNGLALQLFLRLYQITGQTFYRDWAISMKNWLEANMFDSPSGLFIWKIEGGNKDFIKFTYDNAIMIEAYLLYYQIIGGSSFFTKAQNLGIRLNTVLWTNTYRTYYFNTSDARINPAWCGWASQSMIRLYQADGNTAWLDYAQQNIDFINSNLRNNTNYGYYTFCSGNGANLDTRMEGVDQAWMQRIQGLLSQYR